MADTINGIPRVNVHTRHKMWQRALLALVGTKPGTAIHRALAARLDAPIMWATRGRVNLAFGAAPIAVLTSTGAHTGQPRTTPLIYFTDGDDVILVASNYGGTRHPGWYHNLVAHPACELRIGEHGGKFIAHEAIGIDRDHLFELAGDVYPGYADYARHTEGIRSIRVLRLTPTRISVPLDNA